VTASQVATVSSSLTLATRVPAAKKATSFASRRWRARACCQATIDAPDPHRAIRAGRGQEPASRRKSEPMHRLVVRTEHPRSPALRADENHLAAAPAHRQERGAGLDREAVEHVADLRLPHDLAALDVPGSQATVVAAVASCRPSDEKPSENTMPSPLDQARRSAPSSTCHRRTHPSAPVDARRRPSG